MKCNEVQGVNTLQNGLNVGEGGCKHITGISKTLPFAMVLLYKECILNSVQQICKIGTLKQNCECAFEGYLLMT